jgi:hypothetical protein
MLIQRLGSWCDKRVLSLNPASTHFYFVLQKRDNLGFRVKSLLICAANVVSSKRLRRKSAIMTFLTRVKEFDKVF